jgi:hypothetical protein
VGYSRSSGHAHMLVRMDPNAVSEELPALYRAVLDRVAQLEADGHRETARRIRAEAIRIYSRSWDHRACRRLDDLLRRSDPDGVRLRQVLGRTRRDTITA